MSLTEDLRQTLGPAFSIERELGGGGMSRVFVAFDAQLERRVAVKVLAPERSGYVNAERFRREILVVAALQHPHIVPVISAGETNGKPWFTMPFIEGESLRARLGLGTPMRIVDAVSVLRDVARALSYAHDRNIVHRDIKPDNVLLHSGVAIVADFGVAKALQRAREPDTGETAAMNAAGDPAEQRNQTALTTAGSSLGTPPYMAPEQIAADPDADHRVDIYAFGVLAYETLTGKPPFHDRAPHAVLAAHLSEKPRPIIERRADVPTALAELVMRCLEKDPADRPQHARDILSALEDPAVLSGELTPSAVTGASRVVRAARQRRRIMIGGAAGLLVVAAAAVSMLATGGSRDTAASTALPGIAVLPFVALGSDSGDVAARAIASEITSTLAREQGIRVASGNSAAALQQRLSEGQSVADAVQFYMEGVVQHQGERVRLDARMVNASDGFMLWAESYESDTARLLQLRTQVGESVLAAVRERLGLVRPDSQATPGR